MISQLLRVHKTLMRILQGISHNPLHSNWTSICNQIGSSQRKLSSILEQGIDQNDQTLHEILVQINRMCRAIALMLENKRMLKNDVDIIMQQILDSSRIEKKRRLPREKVRILENWFSDHFQHPYATQQDFDELVHMTSLSKTQIRNWISNKRRKERSSTVSTELLQALNKSPP
ncbi:BA75_04427T0 [Komagataella pastoris]|uniref:BA75_04427T0 n=1 Tax=Komagataella pastoris TaxID=4922 RepID=A0A1B2JHT5_PICPA|nr:BA75_04427T0 [Komagataella pastoris]